MSGRIIKGRIIGPPVPVVVQCQFGRTIVRLAVAVELDTHVCVAALVHPDVFPTFGAKITLRATEGLDEVFDFYIVKERRDTGSLPYIERPDPVPESVTGHNDPTKWSDMLKGLEK